MYDSHVAPVRRLGRRAVELLILGAAAGALLAVIAGAVIYLAVLQIGATWTVVGLVGVGTFTLVAGVGVRVLIDQRWGGAHWRELANTGRDEAAALTVMTDDGVTLHVEQAGPPDSPVTVVFCHDVLLNSTYWREQRAALIDSPYRQLYVDQRGHGLSSWRRPDPRVPGVQRFAADLAQVIEQTAPNGVLVLVGHGLGAMAIQTLYATNTELFAARVRGVVLSSTTAGDLASSFDLGMPPLTKWIVRRYTAAALVLAGLVPRKVIATVFGMTPWLVVARVIGLDWYGYRELVRPAAAMAYGTSLATAGHCLAAVLDHDARDAIGDMASHGTVVVMAGTTDRIVSLADQRALADAIEGARYVRVPSVGHLIALERPEDMNDQIVLTIRRACVAEGISSEQLHGQDQVPLATRLIRGGAGLLNLGLSFGSNLLGQDPDEPSSKGHR